MALDQQIRLAAFNWLSKQVQINGDVLDWKLLQKGFPFGDKRIHLVSPQGIFKPKELDIPLAIRTAADGPYDDFIGEGDFIYYKYQGDNPDDYDNLGLRRAMENKTPLIYFFGLVKGKYLPTWPVYIIDDDPSTLTFTVAVDNKLVFDDSDNVIREAEISRRAYITSTVKTRVHQNSFRERVLLAYRSQCSFCKLKHRQLLDAAHIIPDNEKEGIPSVNNGLALCKIHHTAFDKYILGVTPDYEIKVRKDILEEHDGPMLKHGLQELNNQKLILPSSKKAWPNRESLEWRYEKFEQII